MSNLQIDTDRWYILKDNKEILDSFKLERDADICLYNVWGRIHGNEHVSKIKGSDLIKQYE